MERKARALSFFCMISAACLPKLAAVGKPPGACCHCVARNTFFSPGIEAGIGKGGLFFGKIKLINAPASPPVYR